MNLTQYTQKLLPSVWKSINGELLFLSANFPQEGTQVSSSLAALQAERDTLLRSAKEKDAELSALRQQAQQQQSSMDLEKDRMSRELEALRAQLQQQVQTLLPSLKSV